MAKIPHYIRELFARAIDDNTPCLLGSISADGYPRISPKGSMMVYDDETLCYWERSHRGAEGNIGVDPRVVVYYRTVARRNEVPIGRGAMRIFGIARIVVGAAETDRVWNLVPAGEKKTRAKEGYAVFIRVERVEDLLGRPITAD
jgi:hypothetical protein